MFNLDRLYTINADGSNLKPLGILGDSDPSWSADGSKIVFSNTGDLYFMDEDGSSRVMFANGYIYPTWSPDGSQIAFSRVSDAYSVWVTNTDGSNPHAIGSGPGSMLNKPSWSPDGKKIAFVNSGDNIAIVTTDSINMYPITSTNDNSDPTWSPDGKKIAFARSTGAIYVMNPDGTGQHNLTDTSNNVWPSWSPDGSKIAFVSSRDGNHNLYIMDNDGSNQTRLTNFSVPPFGEGTCFYRKPR